MRGGAVWLAVLAASLGACAGTRPKPMGAPAVRAPLAAPKVIPGELEAMGVLGEVPARARKLGAGPVAIVASGEAVDGERLGAFVELPSDDCLFAYARGSSSMEDLDVAAFAEEGSPIVIDEAPDSHPTIMLCPPHPDRVYLGVHVATGAGLVALAAHLVARERADGVARALGARGGGAHEPRAADGWPGLDDRVRVHRTALGGRWEETRKIAIPVDARVPSFVSFPIDADQCTDAVVVPDEGVGQLDVEVLDAEGRSLGRAQDAGRTRALTICSQLAISGSMTIRPHAGRGLAAVALARARGEVARDLTSRPEVAWATSAQPLGHARARFAADLEAHDYDAPTLDTIGTLAAGRRTSLSLGGPSARGCDRVDVIAGAPLALVSGALWSRADALVASAEGTASVTLFGCGRGPHRLDLETRGTPGPFAVVVRPERWQSSAFAAHPLAASRMLGRTAAGPRMMLEGTPLAARAVEIDGEHIVIWEYSVSPGRCLRVSAGAEGDGIGVLLRAFDAASLEELDRSHGAHSASVRACAPPGGPRKLRIELKAVSGKVVAVIGERLVG